MAADPPVEPPVEPIRLLPLLPRRPGPSFVVDVDGSPTGHRALVWALREAARREGTVLAVAAVEPPAGDPLPGQRPSDVDAREAALARADAAVVRAIAETGVSGRVRTVAVDRPLLDALGTAARGGDLVLVGAGGRTLLRPVAPRFPGRRLASGA
ncbi:MULTISPECIES: universal stress protein [unclassified Geodermatophilus]